MHRGPSSSWQDADLIAQYASQQSYLILLRRHCLLAQFPEQLHYSSYLMTSKHNSVPNCATQIFHTTALHCHNVGKSRNTSPHQLKRLKQPLIEDHCNPMILYFFTCNKALHFWFNAPRFHTTPLPFSPEYSTSPPIAWNPKLHEVKLFKKAGHHRRVYVREIESHFDSSYYSYNTQLD